MRKLAVMGLLASSFSLAGCGVNTSGNVDVNANDIKYVQDTRTSLCFAVTASRKTGELDTTGLGLTNVPCTDEVMALINGPERTPAP